MKKTASLTIVATVLLLLSLSRATPAQESASKLEVGPQVSSIDLVSLKSTREPGIGGRFTYNLTDYLALEAEGDLFPSRGTAGFRPGGRLLLGQFGVKAGKRWKKMGLFAKVRPGFASFGETFSVDSIGTETFNGFTFPSVKFSTERKTHFSTNIGAVVEFYPSRRLVARFDAGDTIIRYGSFKDFDYTSPTLALIEKPGYTSHNFQFSAGVGFRFLLPPARDDARPPVPRAGRAKKGLPKYELGGHFTSLTFHPPPPIFGDLVLSGKLIDVTETGFGGWFAYNLTNNLALEAESDFFPRKSFITTGATGRILQEQFGVKAGKRFEKFGVFGKVRPGLILFSDVTRLRSTFLFTFDDKQFTAGRFSQGWKPYFSTDVGGVLEFYPSRRLLTRFDAGDTIIRYGINSVMGFAVNHQIVQRPAETKHNFQFSAGVGFRF